MKRVELIFSQSLEEDVMTMLAPIPGAKFFTLIPGVRGQGNTTPKMGDAVWPQENSLMIIYCEEEDATAIQRVAERIRTAYPDEGCACFVL
jgi:hypothetical protein